MNLSDQDKYQSLLELPLRVDPAVEIVEQSGRYSSQFILHHRENELSYLCSPELKAIMLSLDGSRTLSSSLEESNLDQLSRSQLLDTILQLFSQGFFAQNPVEPSKKRWRNLVKNPFSIKIPLFDTSLIVNYLIDYARLFFNRSTLVASLCLWFIALLSLPQFWPDLASHWESRFFDPINFILLPVSYIFLKVFHEMGHALALKYFGGESRECGIIFLVFFPLPYINCNSIYSIKERKERLWVSFAGMQIELTLAALALFLWATSSPGIYKELLFDIAFTGAISSLLFNLNPLLRFDGYYALSDALGIYNLDQTAKKSFRQVFSCLISRQNPKTIQHRWLGLYALLAIPYRFFISISIALYVSGKFFILGGALALLLVFHQLVLPIIRSLKNAYQRTQSAEQRVRFIERTCAACLILYFVLFELTFSFTQHTEAIVITSQEQQIRVPLTARVSKLLATPSQNVKKGQPLIEFTDETLTIAEKNATFRIKELQQQYQLLMRVDKSQTKSVKHEIEVARSELKEIQRKLASLYLKAPLDGVFILNHPQDLLHSIPQRGTLIGLIHNTGSLTLKMIIREDQLEDILLRLKSVEVIFPADPGESYNATLSTVVPGATSHLPSKLLGTLTGGNIEVDNREQSGMLAMEKIFIADLAVSGWTYNYLPARASLRLKSSAASIADHVSRSISKFLVRQSSTAYRNANY
mgnify:CR=1 FL=1